MKRGFMDFAVEIIKSFPGETARWIVGEVLSQFTRASDLSDAQDPLASLTATLNKQVQTGLERRVWRKKLNDGLYHYFPASMPSTTDVSEDIVIQLPLSAQELKDIENLVAVGKFDSRNNAIKWFVKEGIKVNRAYLDKVANTISQIERLKKEVAE